MNEKLTNEVLEAMAGCVLEAMAGCKGGCSLCEALEVCQGNRLKQFNILATALIEERAKPNPWDGAPETATIADIYWSTETPRDAMSAETLEKLAMRENLVQALLAEGREYHEIKRTLESLTVPKEVQA